LESNKERLIPIGRRCQDTVREWRNLFRRQFDNDDEMAFLLLYAKWPPDHLAMTCPREHYIESAMQVAEGDTHT
jgi:hypothetical protein